MQFSASCESETGKCTTVGAMSWMFPSTTPLLHSTFASLGKWHGDKYNASKDCLNILEEILRKLSAEDQTLRTFRRAIGVGQNISNELIPLLIYVKDDTNICDASKIIDTTIKILVNLTIPVEFLLSSDAVSRTDVGRHTIFELNRLLTTFKEAFTDSRSTKAVVEHMRHVVEKDAVLDGQQCDNINNCLSLLRNILHISEERASVSDCPLARSSRHNEIIWNLFTQRIDKIIIHLISCPQRMYWDVTMVQLIALMYKDQHVGTLQKLLYQWLDTSMSESSEDNESNTSPPDQGDSSPIITSDPTSDSSDNGSGNCTKRSFEPSNISMEAMRVAHNRSKALAVLKHMKSTETENSTSSGVSSTGQIDAAKCNKLDSHPIIIDTPKETTSSQAQSEISDCGYVTQVENQESISTSSNDDDQPHQKPVHQKPQKARYNNQKNRATVALEKKELRRKKLVKRSKTNIINMKGLMHHQPTDDDISNILKEFTVDFLLKGYGSMVHDLHSHLLSNVQVPIDTSHFFWLITYFLKFAAQLELDLEHVSPVLTYEIISYIVFQGVWICEELEISCLVANCDLKSSLRRLHLVVTAIREFLQAVETYHKLSHLTNDDRLTLSRLEEQIVQTQDLKRLFLLLLRQYNPSFQSRQYLQDLIVTNHTYLLFLDNMCKVDDRAVCIMEHLKQFASVEIMRQYGLLLEYFKENGEFVNNCVFTMMHHIGGDLENISTLFQPSILKTFSQIWETDYEICDDWCDLIEYVIHKFINTPRPTHHCSPGGPLSSALLQRPEEQNQKTHHAIMKELLEQNIITPMQLDESLITPQQRIAGSTQEMHEQGQGDVRVLREYLNKENEGTKVLHWLQQLAIEACFVKLLLASDSPMVTESVPEPSVYYYALLHLPIPAVPWTIELSNNLKQPPFISLLHKLGFYLPIDTGKIFVRIPDVWTPDYLYKIAQQLGPVDTSKLKFDLNLLDCQKDSTNVAEDRELKETPSMVCYSPLPNRDILVNCSANDVNMNMKLCSSTATVPNNFSDMEIPLCDDTDEIADVNSACETASVTSDLTRMCVSDEEDRKAI